MYPLEENSSSDIEVASLSTGLKTFVILKQLLLNESLQDKDVIVLDEPCLLYTSKVPFISDQKESL